MVNNLDLSTLVSQIPQAQKIQNAQHTIAPEAQQAMAQAMTQKKQRREQKQVVKTDPSNQETQLDPEDHDAPREHASGGRRERKPAEQDIDLDQGHLIDMQV